MAGVVLIRSVLSGIELPGAYLAGSLSRGALVVWQRFVLSVVRGVSRRIGGIGNARSSGNSTRNSRCQSALGSARGWKEEAHFGRPSHNWAPLCSQVFEHTVSRGHRGSSGSRAGTTTTAARRALVPLGADLPFSSLAVSIERERMPERLAALKDQHGRRKVGAKCARTG